MTELVLKYWQFFFEYYLPGLAKNVNYPKFPHTTYISKVSKPVHCMSYSYQITHKSRFISIYTNTQTLYFMFNYNCNCYKVTLLTQASNVPGATTRLSITAWILVTKFRTEVCSWEEGDKSVFLFKRACLWQRTKSVYIIHFWEINQCSATFLQMFVNQHIHTNT